MKSNFRCLLPLLFLLLLARAAFADVAGSLAATPVLTTPPAASAVPWQGSAALTVVASADGPLAYQWYRGESGDTASPVPGATGPLLVTPPLATATRFWVRVASGGLTVDSPAATVTIDPVRTLVLGGMGYNGSGRLGDGSSISRTTPVQTAAGVSSVSAGSEHTLFVKADGTLWAMGRNDHGQLGDGSTTDRIIPVQIATGVTSVSVGAHHTLFVKTDGTLWAMGSNYIGQLGDGSTTDRIIPVQIATGVVSVSVGAYHTLFVKTDGTLWATGYNVHGQLGDGSTINRHTPVSVATGVASVSSGGTHTLFVKMDGTLWAMGYNDYGQLGDRSTTDRISPVQVASSVSSVSAGDSHTLFVKTDGTLWAMGNNDSGQLGDGSITDRIFPVQVASGVSSVSAGYEHTLFVKTNGTLWAMGDDYYGQLGDGFSGAFSYRPNPVQVANDVAIVSAGGVHTLFLATPRTVTFDLGAHGTRTGGGALVQPVLTNTAATPPTFIVAAGWLFTDWDVAFSSITSDLIVKARYVAATLPVLTATPAPVAVPWGGSTALAVSASANAPLAYQWYRGESGDTTSPVPGATGSLFVTPRLTISTDFWVRVVNAGLAVDSPAASVTVAPARSLALGGMGRNDQGQLGDGSTADRSPAVQVATDVASVSAGSGHTLFVKADGSLWAMGDNSFGQLGDGSTVDRATPVSVATGVLSAAAGAVHSLFVKADGSLWATGVNAYGQLGDGSIGYDTRHVTPVQVATGIASVSAGTYHTLFVKADGSLWAVGENASGQLGDGSTTLRATPVQVASGVLSVSAGGSHTLFVKVDGSLWAMGGNAHGQLGDGTVSTRTTPVQVAAGVASVATGGGHTLFVKTDGTLWAMGRNDSGQLGDGTTLDRATPVQIATGVASASLGDGHSLFVKTDGTLWAMGRNDSGQLGDGSTINRTTPVPVATDVDSVSAGEAFTLFAGRSHTVTFDLGAHGTRTGGGALVQPVLAHCAATAPTFTVAAGWVFTGWDADFTSITADLTITARYVSPALPVLITPPASGMVPWRGPATLTVGATANGPLVYQWYRGKSGDTASPVPGATGPLLVTPPLTATTRFWVRVANGGLSIDSPAATVTVSALPSLALGGMGRNASGQLGDDSTTDRTSPIQSGIGIASVSAGGGHSLFVKTDGTLWATGDNHHGQLGVSTSVLPSFASGGLISVSSIGDGFWMTSVPVKADTGVAFAAAGGDHSLFVKTNGTLWAMGANASGQLGDGTLSSHTYPAQVATGVVAVAAGDYHTLFVKIDGTLWAMGDNAAGQLGDGSRIARSTPVQVATGVASVAAGARHSLFVKTDGTLWAVGDNVSGQLGDGSTFYRSTPVQVATGVVSVSAGGDHTLFVKTDGSLWGMGGNAAGQLGDGSTTGRNTPVRVATGVTTAFAGGAHSLFVKTDGTLWATGRNDHGQLGDGSTIDRFTPVRVATGVTAVSAGPAHTLFLGQSFTVTFTLGARATRVGGGALVQPVMAGTSAIAPTLDVAAGWVLAGWDVSFASVAANLTVAARYAAATPPVLSVAPAPRDVPWQGSAALTVAAYANGPLTYQWYRGESGDTAAPVPGATGPLLVTPALTATARFWVRIGNSGRSIDSPATTVTVAPARSLNLSAMGANDDGQLGDGSTTSRPAPVPVATGVASVGGGGSHTLFVKTDGSLWAMGANYYGQLGDGSTTGRIVPVPVTTGVASVSADDSHSLFVTTDGYLCMMGVSTYGPVTRPVTAATGIASSVAAGSFYFVKTDASLWVMDMRNVRATTEPGSEPQPLTLFSPPVQVATGVASVSAGGGHTLFVKTDGTLWAMGSSEYGQLGDGSSGYAAHRDVPVQIATGVASVAAGAYHTLFIKTDASLWAMGRNDHGQLGDGSTTDRSIPVLIATGVASVSAGGGHTLFVKTDGSLWTMGYNDHGQLGDGSYVDRATPVQVATGVVAASAGFNHSMILSATFSVTVTFDVGAHGHRAGGGEPGQTLAFGAGATAPDIVPDEGWLFLGWDADFSAVTTDLTVHAVYHRLQTLDFAAPTDRDTRARPFALNASASSTLPVLFTLVSGPATLGADGTTLTLTGAPGTVVIRAYQPGGVFGGDTYAASPALERSFAVVLPPTLTLPASTTLVYDGTPRAVPAITTPAGLTVTTIYKSGSGAATSAPPTEAGTYLVTATLDDPSLLVTRPPSVTGTLVIAKKALEVRVAPVSRLVGKPNPAFALTYSGLAPADMDAGGQPLPGVIGKAPAVTTKAVAASAQGDFALKRSGGQARNYTFVPGTPFGPLTVVGFGGDYEALFFDPTLATGSLVPLGKLTLSVPANSLKFTGRLSLASASVDLPLAGTLGSDAPYASALCLLYIPANARAGTPARVLAFTLNGDALDATLSSGSPPAVSLLTTVEGGARLATVAPGAVSPWAGAYTLLLRDASSDLGGDRVPDARPYPTGTGHATGEVATTTGLFSLAGRLADGTVFTTSARPDSAGRFRLFVKPYGTRFDSTLGGTLGFEVHPDQIRFPGGFHVARDHGLLLWTKAPLPASTPPARQDKTHRLGFGPLDLTATLDPWLPPISVQAATKTTPARAAVSLARRLGLPSTPGADASSPFVLEHGPADLPFGALLAALPNRASLGVDNRVTITATSADAVSPIDNPAAWKMTITPATGAFAGSFVLKDRIILAPATATQPAVTKLVSRTLAFSGVLRQRPDLSEAAEDGLLGSALFLLAPAGVPGTDEQKPGEIQLHPLAP